MAKDMYTMKELKLMGKIPSWLVDELRDNCKLCDVPIISNLEMTERRCANPYCLLHMQYKGNSMVKKLNIDGVGPKTVFNLMQQYTLLEHVDILKYLINYKPELHLWEIAEIVGIPGLKKKLDDLLAGWGSFSDYFASTRADKKLLDYKPSLLNAEKYFKVKQPLSTISLSIMMTGNFINYRPRERFIERCNDTFGRVLKLKLVGAINSANYLILGNNGWGKDKIKKAVENNIPYGTEEDFLKYILKQIRRVMGEDIVE